MGNDHKVYDGSKRSDGLLLWCTAMYVPFWLKIKTLAWSDDHVYPVSRHKTTYYWWDVIILFSFTTSSLD